MAKYSHEIFDESTVYSFLFDFEKATPKSAWVNFLQRNSKLPLISILLYFLLIHYGPKAMSNRKAFKLKPILFLWNSSLAVFSMAATIRFSSFMMYEMSRMSLQEKICHSQVDNVTAFWGTMYVLSKIFEMGDTLLLILRKRQVIFLHWYHHTTVLLFCWFSAAVEAPFSNYFGLINCFIHSLMYSYYACQTIGIKFPKLISMSLTTLQISQMILGLYGLYLQFDADFVKGLGCTASRNIWFAGVLMYGSYFGLFVNFFVRSYLFRGQREGKNSVGYDKNNNIVKKSI